MRRNMPGLSGAPQHQVACGTLPPGQVQRITGTLTIAHFSSRSIRNLSFCRVNAGRSSAPALDLRGSKQS